MWIAASFLLASPADGQMTLVGRLLWPPMEGSASEVGIGHVLVFGSLPGEGRQPLAFRSWETNPVGWYRLSGPAGSYTLLFAQPGKFMRPAILNNIYTRDGESINLSRSVRPPWDLACMDESAWDRTAAHEYYQPFVARGESVTQVGFKLAHDGVDGPGPGSQDLVVSIHEVKEDGSPSKWPRVGPEISVVDVDCGGAKCYSYSAGFDSGEVKTTAGKTYAVRIAAKADGGKFQPFWHPIVKGEKYLPAYRASLANEFERTQNHLWLAIGGDSDGLLIPYNKRVCKEFNQLTKFSKVWSQTYVAKGRSLAGVVLYAAASGVQPSMNLQRLQVTVRADGPKGELIGISKLAIGNGLYTGDASWGTFGAVYEPDEVMLEPGKTYCLQFESVETAQSLGLGTFANIKGMKSDGRPGFNPYRKHKLDECPQGQAFLDGEPQDFDLDMQVIEYDRAVRRYDLDTTGPRLLKGGEFSRTDNDWKSAWVIPAKYAATSDVALSRGPMGQPLLRLAGKGKKFDAVLAQRVAGLSATETYRVSGGMRANQLPSEQCRTSIGIDPTGQTDDADAASVIWLIKPGATNLFEGFTSEPVRPTKDSVSVFLRLRANDPPGPVPDAEFEVVSMRAVVTAPPRR
jgi:hypothetical protein